jgi:hypothetical protein
MTQETSPPSLDSENSSLEHLTVGDASGPTGGLTSKTVGGKDVAPTGVDEPLPPCPFCGKSVGKLTHARELADDPEEYMHSDSWAVLCDAASPDGPGGCGASGGFFPTEAEAIAAWNRRATALAFPQASVVKREFIERVQLEHDSDLSPDLRGWSVKQFGPANEACSRQYVVIERATNPFDAALDAAIAAQENQS